MPNKYAGNLLFFFISKEILIDFSESTKIFVIFLTFTKMSFLENIKHKLKDKIKIESFYKIHQKLLTFIFQNITFCSKKVKKN